MSTAAVTLVAAALSAAPQPTAPPDDAAAAPQPATEPAAPTDDTPEASPDATPEAGDQATAAPEGTDATEPLDPAAAEPELATEPEPEPKPEPKPEESGKVYYVSEGAGAEGPPYYTAAQEAELRKRHGLEPIPPADQRQARWRCLIADPTCGISFEINATAAYAYRVQQGDVSTGEVRRWSSGRAQYDFWLDLPVLAESVGNVRYTRISLGPKGGVTFSDSESLWGNLGVAARYWFGRGKWAPALEFTSALTFKLRGTSRQGTSTARVGQQRGPVGFTADIGFGLGGFGAIVIGGQYDSPLAREDVPEMLRESAAGMFFVGFRGNILWGGPAAAAAVTHGLTQRFAEPPP